MIRSLAAVVFLVSAWGVNSVTAQSPRFRAGASAVDITPTRFPVILNGGFLEGQIPLATDKLHARCLALDDGKVTLAMVVVDSCMIPRTVCDEAKRLSTERCGLSHDRILIAATHTHSAPSVMDYCLGSRADPEYTAFLPGKIAEAVERAVANLQPAKAGYGKVDATSYTSNRRWIVRAGKELSDPFGETTVRAMMHPGHLNDDYVGPSGPVDPWLSFLSIQDSDGAPLAWLGNFSMHYFSGHAGASPDYFGLVAREVTERLAPRNPAFVAIQSQGTSGDLWWGDYSKPKVERRIDDYARDLAQLALDAHAGIEHRGDITLAMAERRIELARRLPTEKRLGWARELLAQMGDRRPRNQPEVYAEQAVYLHENPTEECVLQAIRIGELGITGIPNEVYAITGLKLKAQSPTEQTINLSLANGAAGYIPPPEQHHLGGYTTWPARTAGLEKDAEPQIVDETLRLLESVSGRDRRAYREPPSRYFRAIMRSEPVTYWRLGEMSGTVAHDVSGHEYHASYEPGIAFFLPGIASRNDPRSGHDSRSIHLAGGRVVSPPLALKGKGCTIECWVWNGVPGGARSVTGWLLEHQGLQLGIAGQGDHSGKLMLRVAGEETPRNHGLSSLTLRYWHHVALVREPQRVRLFLDGKQEAELKERIPPLHPKETSALFIGGLEDAGAVGFEGRIDEVALFDQALSEAQIQSHGSPSDAQANGRRPEPPPLEPKETLETAHIAPGYRIELVAAEPLVKDPVAIDWGPDGRLWVVEMADYPYGMDGNGSPGGRVRFLVDTDKDGTYDRSTLFIDGLSFPTSVLAWHKGVLIAAAPEILYAEDTDGDGKADKREVLFSGFMEGNQQLRVNGLRWGLDNWIHAAGGGHHAGFGKGNNVRSNVTGEEIPLGSRDLRFRPDEGLLEPRSGPSQFGRVRDDWGQWYGVQNSYPLWHYVLDDHYLQRNPLVPAIDTRHQLRLPSNPRVFPATPAQKRYHSFEHSGRFTSACGPSLYRDDLLFPRIEKVAHAFTCEPFHNLVQHHVLREDGVSFAGTRGERGEELDFFASTDRWCRPVMTRTGPDGALWIVDMYRYMIEHPDWLPPEGRKELEPFYRSGEDRGRIYRVYRQDRPPRRIEDRTEHSASELVAALSSPTGHLRDLAQRLLVQSRDLSAVEGLEVILAESPSPRARIHALATLDGLEALSEEMLLKALNDRHSAVRRHALILTEPRADSSIALRKAAFALANDPDSKVRLQLACALGEWQSEDAGQALFQLALESPEDPYLDAAILSSIPKHLSTMALSLNGQDFPMREAILLGMLTTAPSQPEIVPELLERVFPKQESDSPHWRQLRLLAHWLKILRAQLGEDAPERWFPDGAESLLATARREAANQTLNEANRLVAMGALGWLPACREDDVETLRAFLAPSVSAALQRAAIEILGRIPGRAPWECWQERWKTLSPALRSAVFDQLLARKDLVQWLLQALEEGAIAKSDLDPAHRQQLLNHPDDAVAQKARLVVAGDSHAGRSEELQRRRRQVLMLKGEASRGQPIFAERCATCHLLGEVGQAIGPDLRALSDTSADALLSGVIDPNASIDPRYIAYTATLKGGGSMYGLILTETGNSLIFRTLDGAEHAILRSRIVALESTAFSFMPEGLEEGLSDQEIADLIAFVRSQSQPQKPD